MTGQTKASLVALGMFVLPFAASLLFGKEGWKTLFENVVFFFLLLVYILVMLILFLYGQRGMTWERLQAPVWERRAKQAKQVIPILYGPAEDTVRRRRWTVDRPLVEAAVKRGDAEFLYRLALEYHEEWYFNEAIELLQKAAELDSAGPWGADARAKLKEWGPP